MLQNLYYKGKENRTMSLNTPEEHHPLPDVADNFKRIWNTPEKHHPSPNVADNFNAPEVVDSDDMEIDDDCMETNYILCKNSANTPKRTRTICGGGSYKVRNRRYGQRRGQEKSTRKDSDEKKEVFPQDAGGIHVSILPPEKRRDHGPNLQTTRLSRGQGRGYKTRSEKNSEQSHIQVRCLV